MSATAPAFQGLKPPSLSTDLTFGAAVCAVFLFCVILARPFAPSAFNDDWSYGFVAYNLQKAGHLQYSGWGSPMVLFQSAWGAFWTHIFGFSFNVLRLATLPFSLGFVVAVYALGRKAGLVPSWAAFGAATVALSPLFIPLAASFMTEPYSCFFTVVCIYAALAAVDTKSRGYAVVWLYVLLVAGVLGGSSRQTVWTAPVALIPYLAFRKRSDRVFLGQASLAFVLCVAALLYCSLHFTQPYAVFQLSPQQLFHLAVHQAFWVCVSLFMLALTCLLLAWPALLCLAPLWLKLPRRFLFGAVLGSGILAFVLLRQFGDGGVIPYVGNVFSPYGVLYVGQEGLGFRPKLLQNRYMVILSAGLFFSSLAAFMVIRRRRTKLPSNVRDVFLVSALAYLPLLLPGALLGILFDRYTLPLLPLLVIWILVHAQAGMEQLPMVGRIPNWGLGAVMLLAFAGYGAAATHDYYAALRARAKAAETVQAQGVARSKISAGFEYDGWTQLQTGGHFHPVGYKDRVIWNTSTVFWFWPYTTVLQPEYLTITKMGSPVSNSKALVAVPYRAWFAPHQRYAGIWKTSDVPKTQVCGISLTCKDMDHPLSQIDKLQKR